MHYLLIGAVSFAAGIMASMGLGGGMLLIVYLTVFGGFSQIEAQGINLVFFLPIAAASLIFHAKNKLICTKKAIPTMLAGIAGSIVFGFAAARIHPDMLSKAFGIFLILMGGKEIFSKSKTK